ncbi:hypothetical protein [Absidia glauca]|uniref:Uncharacterized protein n=1 Tax=Absidia glauca TaxID=4829 RepID=A0A163KKU6_ABSGL|nr:hypothetical protein [Absidia glauca]
MYHRETRHQSWSRSYHYQNRVLSYQPEQQSHHIGLSGVEAPSAVFALTPAAWVCILEFLPLNQVLALPLVCRDFRNKVFNIPEFWKAAYIVALTQSSGQLSLPKMDLWYHGLLCRRWFTGVLDQICDVCYAGFGMEASDYGWLSTKTIRIPVSHERKQNLRRERYSTNLCGVCRINYYQANPEPISVSGFDGMAVVTSPERQSKLLKKYALAESDGVWLSPLHFTDVFVHIFARVIFGGEVGIDAERKKGQRQARPAIAAMAETRMTALVDQLRREPLF